jgi:anti-sigma-K factor RskA
MSEHDRALERDPPDDDLLAAEHVLGLHGAVQRRQLQARVEADPDFAARVAAWEARFAAWYAQIAPVAPPPQLWPRLRARLGWPAAMPVEAERRLRFWKGTTAAALAMAAALAVVALVRPWAPEPPAPERPPLVVAPEPQPAPAERPKPVVVLAGDDGAPGWLAAVDAAAGAVTMVPVPGAVDPGPLAGELWLIPEGEAPRSLGLVSHQRAHTVDVPAALRAALAVGATLAVTLEPEAGIPHPAPTGPIVAAGRIDAI